MWALVTSRIWGVDGWIATSVTRPIIHHVQKAAQTDVKQHHDHKPDQVCSSTSNTKSRVLNCCHNRKQLVKCKAKPGCGVQVPTVAASVHEHKHGATVTGSWKVSFGEGIKLLVRDSKFSVYCCSFWWSWVMLVWTSVWLSSLVWNNRSINEQILLQVLAGGFLFYSSVWKSFKTRENIKNGTSEDENNVNRKEKSRRHKYWCFI